MEKREIKVALLQKCKEHLQARRKAVQGTLENLAISLQEETKSSAGDKHETGRAMLQLERENAGKQLAEIEKLEKIFTRIRPEVSMDPIHLGSVIKTDKANYYIAIPVGKVRVNKIPFYAIGVQSPIGQLLLGKMKGDVVRFRESVITITDLF